ncbi:growth arrest-specific protein 1 [Gastrophryne carolinensis]
MASCGVWMLLMLCSVLGAARGRRLICWQAMLECHREAPCNYAYSQYHEACASVLPRSGEAMPPASARRRCPSHCISALIQLNSTRAGPALEDCDCAEDQLCKATKRAIEPCLPRTGGGGGGGSSVMGCMEARRQCENDRRCHASLSRYLSKCGRLFNGVRCTDECRAVIEDMMRVPKALLLNDCVCDGLERPICESIKENMARLCFGAEMASSGSSDYDYYDEDYDSQPAREGSWEEEAARVDSRPDPSSAAPSTYYYPLWTVGVSLALMLRALG